MVLIVPPDRFDQFSNVFSDEQDFAGFDGLTDFSRFSYVGRQGEYVWLESVIFRDNHIQCRTIGRSISSGQRLDNGQKPQQWDKRHESRVRRHGHALLTIL